MKVFIIEGIRIYEEVLTTKFACDYDVCHGECCRVKDAEEGEFEGCPITALERAFINQLFGEDATYEKKGELYVSTDKKSAACVLQSSKGCRLNKPPMGCRLYPLYVEVHKYTYLKVGHFYDEYHYCDCAYEKGKREDILLVEFLKQPLIDRFGERFYYKLLHKARCYDKAV